MRFMMKLMIFNYNNSITLSKTIIKLITIKLNLITNKLNFK